MWLFVLFLAVPIIEIALFIQVGGLIGLWPTLGIVILTAIVGTAMVRAQGALALAQLRGSLRDLRDPAEPLAHGAMILIAGVLLLTPGFFTDAAGLALLIPTVRAAAFRYLKSRIRVQGFSYGQAHGQAQPSGPMPRHAPPARGDVIDADYHEVDDSLKAAHPTSKKPTHPGPRSSSGWTRH